jgi:hypothetical protein
MRLNGGSENRRGRAGCSRAAISSTRCRRSGEALGRAARSSVASSGDSIGAHHPFQLLERAAQAGRARARTDSQDAGGGLAVELEHDPQRDDFAFCPGQLCKRVLELGRETFAEARRRHLAQLAHGVAIFSPQTSPLRPKVVQRGRACELAQPCAGPAPPWIETAEAPKRALEGLDREVFGEGLVGSQVHEIAKDVVEVLLGDGGEALLLRVHDLYTPPTSAYVTAATTAAS